MRSRIPAAGTFFLLSAVLWAAGPGSAWRDLNLGRADQALQSLNRSLTQNPNDAESHNLRCRVYYQESEWDKAIADCEAAVSLDPQDSNDHLWLARAYGQRASAAPALLAYKFARKAHAEFEKAAQLDPHNAAALADLGEFDVDAPAVVGGGIAHAQDLVAPLRALNPSDALALQARIAEAQKQPAAAEADLKAAIAVSSQPADAWMDLATFYLRQKRPNAMLAAARTGASLDTRHGPALVRGANDLILANLEPQTAILWLTEYLNAHAQSETAPTFVVRAELANLLLNQGDSQGAQQQLSAVHALASGYRVPALSVSAKSGV